MIGNMCGSEGKNLLTGLGRDVSPNTSSWVLSLVQWYNCTIRFENKNLPLRTYTYTCIHLWMYWPLDVYWSRVQLEWSQASSCAFNGDGHRADDGTKIIFLVIIIQLHEEIWNWCFWAPLEELCKFTLYFRFLFFCSANW